MAEEGVVVPRGYSVYILRQTLSKTGVYLTRVLLITGGTKNCLGTHLRSRGRTDVDQVVTESVGQAIDEPAVEKVKGEGESRPRCRQIESEQVRNL